MDGLVINELILNTVIQLQCETDRLSIWLPAALPVGGRGFSHTWSHRATEEEDTGLRQIEIVLLLSVFVRYWSLTIPLL